MIIVCHHLSPQMHLPIPLAIFKYEQFGKGKYPREDLKNMSYKTQWEFWLGITNTQNTLTISPFGNFGTKPFTTLMSTSIPIPLSYKVHTHSFSQTRHNINCHQRLTQAPAHKEYRNQYVKYLLKIFDMHIQKFSLFLS